MNGIMSLPKLSEQADYLQFDICGLSKDMAFQKYKKYNRDLPVILHGDWTKNGNSENNFFQRYSEYISIINILKEHKVKILGFTIHPITRSQKENKFIQFVNMCNKIYTDCTIPVFIENRSSKNIFLSQPDEIIQFSKNNIMTIDVPQLYISCGYSFEYFLNVLKQINIDNVKEIHLGNVIRKNNHSFVARSLDDGEIDYKQVFPVISKVHYFTFEILGSYKTFERNINLI